MTVTDDVTGTSSLYHVTRDAPVVTKANADGTFEVVNTTFEPKKGVTEGEFFIGLVSYNYAAEGDIAITLTQDGKDRTLDAKPNPYAQRSNPEEAEGNAIHIGGRYTSLSGGSAITGSLGCFTLCGKDSGNAGIETFRRDIEERATVNRKAGKGGAIRIGIVQRSDVILKANYSAAGKVVEVLETQK